MFGIFLLCSYSVLYLMFNSHVGSGVRIVHVGFVFGGDDHFSYWDYGESRGLGSFPFMQVRVLI